MHGGRVIDIVHVCLFHQGGGLQKAQRSAEVDGGGTGGFYLFAQFHVGMGPQKIDGELFWQLFEECRPFFFWILLGEPDGGGGDGEIGFGLIRLDLFFIRCCGIKSGFGRVIVGEGGDEYLVAFDLMPVADDMGDLFGEEETQRVFVKADGPACAGKRGEEAGGGETLDVDHGIVPGPADKSDEVVKVPQLMPALIPDEHFVEEGVAGQEGLIAFSHKEVDMGVGIKGMKFFDEGCCQDNVTYKRRLYDQKFLHGCKVRAFQGRMRVIVPSGFHFTTEDA